MHKQLIKKSVRRFRPVRHAVRLSMAVRLVVLAGLVAVGGLGITQRVEAAQTSSDYCGQYSASGGQRNACKDGILGKDCNDYAITYDQATADICSKAAQAKSSGQISDTPTISVSPSPSTSSSPTAGGATDQAAYKNAILLACAPYQNDNAAALWCLYGGLGQNGTAGKPVSNSDCLTKPELQGSTANQAACITGSRAGNSYISTQNSGSSSSSNPNAIQDQLDQANSLSQYIDVLHAAGSDSKTDTSTAADNNYGSYVNGAGKQQTITVKESGQQNSPAIVFFNGGGWHQNDHTSDYVATGDANKNGDSNLGSSSGAPAGGGATARGYTVIDVSYRLGSSGVYYMFEDVMRGLKHVIDNAGLYHIDASKVAIWGDSAGGSLSMRVAASGKSGAKAAVGWSAPTNAYTALFKSYKSLLIGMDHSTCVPTDLAGLTNTTDLMNGGSGDVAQYGQGLSSNDFSSLGIGGDSSSGGGSSDPLGTLTQVLTAAQYASTTSQNVESISKQLESGASSSGGTSGTNSTQSALTGMMSSMSGGVFNLASKKLNECIDNFNALSPALFTSPETPPSFLAGYDNDDLIDPSQLTGMSDKLHTLGIRSDTLILPGDPSAPSVAFGATNNHLGYDPIFVCQTLDFLDSIIQPDKGIVDCATGKNSNDQSAAPASGSGGGSGASNSGSPSSPSSNNNNGCPAGQISAGGTSGPSGDTVNCVNENTSASAQSKCISGGGSWADRRGTGNPSCSYNPNSSGVSTSCVTWEQGCYNAPQTQSGTTYNTAPCPAGQTNIGGGPYGSITCK